MHVCGHAIQHLPGPCLCIYAHIEMVVTFVVVCLFTAMVITRHHEAGQVPGVVEMNPTNLLELFKPSRGLGKPKITSFKRLFAVERMDVWNRQWIALRACMYPYESASAL